MRRLEQIMPANVKTMMSNAYNLEKLVYSADLLIGCYESAQTGREVIL